MASANTCFLEARIAEQRNVPYSNSQGALTMARRWLRCTEMHKRWQHDPPRGDQPDALKEQARTLDDVEALLPNQYILDGTQPPVNEELRLTYLDLEGAFE
ncbi:Hypothetical predicted protein [Lecanosticta acicola]|uniref:Uncharacterized protein n=1 Tax=Lecanosticta acicola TaxID=111012 RepID=A0AAI8YRJ9_9PEZI|nr:Hypothetical predicted protein [Lecanosticta acicola]